MVKILTEDVIMANKKYAKGSAMTFPLELAETKDISYEMDDMYLYPREVLGIQKEIEDICNRMECDGSVMYDEFPDKVTIELIAKKIAENLKNNEKNKYASDESKWLLPLIQVMICKELNFRRDRRNKHKSQIKLS